MNEPDANDRYKSTGQGAHGIRINALGGGKARGMSWREEDPE
jgi:hypothetical protein